ncbi:MAG: RNA methyltransferase [Halanaerobiaceae bacterium]
MSRNDADVYLALIHDPIYNIKGEKITTTVTNYDLHDISRAGKTYDINKYFVVNHLESQKALVERMKNYWTEGYGADYNDNRSEAFGILTLADTLEDVIAEIEKENAGKTPALIATDASDFPDSYSYKKMRKIIFNSDIPFLIIFGTGWGLTEETFEKCDYILNPIWGRGDFNHLSVRSAASIIIDRLLCAPWWE